MILIRRSISRFATPAVIAAAAMFLSCSLKYDEEVDTAAVVPELQFTNSRFTRYEDNRKSMSISAALLEQYKNGNSTYAKDASFTTWNEDGSLSTSGRCGLLSSNSDDEIYTLFDSIELENHEQNFKIQAESLKWNSKNEQLVSGRKEKVRLIRDDVDMEGTGFSASGVSRTFSFTSGISGTITTGEADEH